MDAQPDYLIRLKPLPSPRPAAVRIRLLLKWALRQAGLKCVEIREVPPVTTTPEPPSTT